MPSFLWPGHRDVPAISDAALAALLEGAEPIQGSASPLRSLAEILADLTGQPGGDELDGKAETLTAFRNQFGAPGRAHRSHRHSRRLLFRPSAVKAATAAAAALGLGTFATAAYAGALPAPVQRLAHEIIAAPPPRVQPAARGSAPPVTGQPAYGLCAAWAHAKADGTRAQRAAAFGKLAAAAGGTAKVTEYCAATAHPGTSSSHRPHPAPTPHSTGKPSAQPTPHGSGKPSTHPTPQGSGKPSAHPTPHGSGEPSAHPTPHGTGGPTVHPTSKPGTSGQHA